VLLLDHDRDVLNAMGEVLREEGATVFATTSDDGALEAIHAGFRPSVIVVDAIRPGDRERGFLDRLRADPATAAIPIVVMSTDPMLLRLLGRRGDAVIEKPFSIDTLHQTLAQVCAGA
jgi:CheY-like chemotaxis protein